MTGAGPLSPLPPSIFVSPAKSLPRTRYGAGVQETLQECRRLLDSCLRRNDRGRVIQGNHKGLPLQGRPIYNVGASLVGAQGTWQDAWRLLDSCHRRNDGRGTGMTVVGAPGRPAGRPYRFVSPAKSLPRTRYGAGAQGGPLSLTPTLSRKGRGGNIPSPLAGEG